MYAIKTFIVILVYTILMRDIASKPFDLMTTSNSSISLYDDTDSVDVVALDGGNFTRTVYDSPTAWAVEFYVHWCGYCQRFAPHWKSLSHDVVDWKDIVKLGVINCAIDINTDVCTHHKSRPWPTVKYFSAYTNNMSDIGEKLEKEYDRDFLRRKIVEALKRDQERHKSPMTWPNLTSYSVSVQDMWTDVPDEIKYKFLLFEQADSHLGSEVILDLHKMKNGLVRRVTPESPLWAAYNVTDSPELIALDRLDVVHNINISDLTRREIDDAIVEFMQTKGFMLDEKKYDVVTEKTVESTVESHAFEPAKWRRDLVFQSDLERAVKESLEVEVSSVETIDGDKMKALNKYLGVLTSYFPKKINASRLLTIVRDEMMNKTSIKGEDLRHFLMNKTMESKCPFFKEPLSWVGCRGTTPKLRGYTCGLWTLFHTLTVNFANANDCDSPPTQILTTVYEYVKHFFGCEDCAQHFMLMVDKNRISDVKSKDEAVLWLWRRHNSVNERLAKDPGADPRFPKVQYPMKEHCNKCRNEDDTWNEAEVLKHLKKKYGSYMAL